jgi:magnesium-transporting ATPase (P-type)
MVRSVLGVIGGYVLMLVLQIATFMIVYTVMGANWSFKPRAFQASTRWTLMQFAVVLITAAIAGFVCAIISKSSKAPLALAGLVLLLGLALAAGKVMTQPADPHDVRVGPVPNMEAMQKARHPAWVIFLGPFIGAAGVVIGGKLKRRG